MANKIFGWNEDDVKYLFGVVSTNKTGIINSFNIVAKELRRKPMSVRNYYYNIINNMKINENFKNKIFNLVGQITIGDKRRFCKNDEKTLLLKILDNTDNVTVRQKCMVLANNDKQKFVRLQNKYRNLIKNNKNLVRDCLYELHSNGIVTRKINLDKNNIISMPMRNDNILSDLEIQSIFMGLVKLIKNNTEKIIKKNIIKENIICNNTFNEQVNELKKQNMLITNLKQKNKDLDKQVNVLNEKLENQKIKNNNEINTINELFNSNKMKELQNFLIELDNKININKHN